MSVPNTIILAMRSHGTRGQSIHTRSMSKIRLGMCQDMKTDILKLVEEMIFVRCVVRFVMNACSLWHPTHSPNGQHHVYFHDCEITFSPQGEGDPMRPYVSTYHVIKTSLLRWPSPAGES